MPLNKQSGSDNSNVNKRVSIGMDFGLDEEEDQDNETITEDSTISEEEGLGAFETCVEFDLDEVLHFTHDEEKPSRPDSIKHKTK